jgi:membrane-bound metal-dependent hydrolase YbcI (DUF457 family)
MRLTVDVLMMGRSHLMLGAGGFLLLANPILEQFHTHLDSAQLAAGAVVTAGTSMFPDLDTENSTIAHALGPVTRILARFVGTVSGGHRNGTHGLLFAAMMTMLTAWGVQQTASPWVKLGVCTFFVCLAVRVLTEARGLICLALAALIGATVATVPGDQWLVCAVGLGCLLHMLGDFLTAEGVPLLYPFSRRRFSLPIIRETGNKTEGVIAFGCGLACCWLMATMVFVPMWKTNNAPSKTPAAARTSAPHTAGAPTRLLTAPVRLIVLKTGYCRVVRSSDAAQHHRQCVSRRSLRA